LPDAVLIHIDCGTVLSCDDFQLIGKSTVVTDNITIFINYTFANQMDAVFAVQKQIFGQYMGLNIEFYYFLAQQ
jgi:hypothetical protein